MAIGGCAAPDRQTAITAGVGQNGSSHRPETANFVDTITVARLPTGSCEWSTVTPRLRYGNPGTTTRAEHPNEKTCTVVASNYTTGSSTEPPEVVAFAYVQDFKHPPPGNAVLNFADTFTVARTADGTCDWSRIPNRRGKPGSASYLGEMLATKCWGVVYNVTYPPRPPAHVEADTTTGMSAGAAKTPPRHTPY
jgi:hypothetical protein